MNYEGVTIYKKSLLPALEGFSHMNVHQNHLVGLLRSVLVGSNSKASNSGGLGWAWKYAHLTSTRVMVKRLVQGPHF